MRTSFGSDFDRRLRSGPVLVASSRMFASKRRISRSAATPLLRIEQSPTNHVQIGERGRHFEAVQILCQTAVANLTEAQDVLDHTEYVLHLGSHSGFVAVLGFLGLIDLPMEAIALICEVLGSRRMPADEVRLALIALGSPESSFSGVQPTRERLAGG